MGVWVCVLAHARWRYLEEVCVCWHVPGGATWWRCACVGTCKVALLGGGVRVLARGRGRYLVEVCVCAPVKTRPPPSPPPSPPSLPAHTSWAEKVWG